MADESGFSDQKGRAQTLEDVVIRGEVPGDELLEELNALNSMEPLSEAELERQAMGAASAMAAGFGQVPLPPHEAHSPRTVQGRRAASAERRVSSRARGPVTAYPPAMRVMSEEKQETHPFTIAVAVLLLVAAVWALMFRVNVREYYLYLTEQRPGLSFHFQELSEEWGEPELHAYFKGQHVFCASYAPGEFLGERACFFDMKTYLGAPAMNAAFFFNAGKLDSASISVPVWSHGAMRAALEKTYGAASVLSESRVSALPLERWRLANRSALFLNQDAVLNPVAWNTVMWMSPRTCQQYLCLD